jgi:phenylacetate-coenzyme A ligase PaaK-like adenylate-forming protein
MSYQPENCFAISSEDEFNECALATFRYQVKNVLVYRQYVELLGVNTLEVQHYSQIPFLPISVFKSKSIISSDQNPEIVFTSSGTTGMITSRHLVGKLDLYEQSFLKGFQNSYGSIEGYCVIGLLPAYLEREGSSLVYMVNRLIEKSNHPQSGFYLNQYAELQQLLQELKTQKQKTILIGVTFALLDMAESFPMNFPDLIVMETGGMKGRRKEIVREELHQLLSRGFGVEKIHSEYGMTELLSQAYSKGDGLFDCPSWMRISIREINDPKQLVKDGITGGVNIIDLANYYSCSFISTQDLGKIHSNNQFEIVGRFDNADLRGCNLLVH